MINTVNILKNYHVFHLLWYTFTWNYYFNLTKTYIQNPMPFTEST